MSKDTNDPNYSHSSFVNDDGYMHCTDAVINTHETPTVPQTNDDKTETKISGDTTTDTTQS